MNKKIILLLCLLFLFSGCNTTKEEKRKIKEKEEIKEEEKKELPQIEEYIDDNNTPIAIYLNKKKIVEFKSDMTIGKDIVKFQIYPSNDDYLSYSGLFAQAFNDKFKEYNKNNNLKIGFNLSYDVLDGRHFSHNILNASNTTDYEGYILVFLYDDYDLYKNNKIYSHIEVGEETDKTLFSSIKLYPGGAIHKIASKVLLTVFTYDSEDDFDDNGEYRGNSKYSITICENGKTC